MERTPSNRYQPQRSPRLQTKKSIPSSFSKDDAQTLKKSTNSDQGPIGRSNSMEYARTRSVYDYMKPTITSSSTKKKAYEVKNEKESIANFMQRSSTSSRNNSAVPKRSTRSCPTSPLKTPSAWALSPGRASPLFLPPETEGKGGFQVKSTAGNCPDGSNGGGGSNGVVKGVLKFFKHKKVSKVQQENFHQLRILQNRLVQWRFANARAEAVMNSMKRVSEYKIFCVWVKIFTIRSTILEKGLQVQKMKQGIKLCEIIFPQIYLLSEWEKLEKKNSEALNRLAMKLSALSARVPLVHGAQADEMSLFEAIRTAEVVANSIKWITKTFLPKAEKILYLLTELMIVLKQEEECIKEMDKHIYFVQSLSERERSLRVHLVQGVCESIRGNG